MHYGVAPFKARVCSMSMPAVRPRATSGSLVTICLVDWTQRGLWLIGIGSLIVVLTVVLGAPRPTDAGLSFAGPFTSARARLLFAAEAAGLLHVAAGGVIVSIVEFTQWWFAGLTLLTITNVAYLLIAWKQHQYRLSRVRDIEDRGTPESPEEVWRSACTKRCSSWLWCVRHALDDEPWPGDCYRLPGAPRRDS